MNRTGIEWTDRTWNPVTGCKHNCEYCYARDLAETRLEDIYPNGFQPTFWRDRIEQPLSKTKPCKIFVSSMGDLFGEWVPEQPAENIVNDVMKNAIGYDIPVFVKDNLEWTSNLREKFGPKPQGLPGFEEWVMQNDRD